MTETGFQVGELIENRYRVLSTLGAGGMGTVYRVADEARSGEVVALKTLKLDASAPGMVQGFQREFQMLVQLRHPNLVSVHDYGVTAAGGLYFTMEYVRGLDLRASARQLGDTAIIPLIVQMCRALAYIHARGVIHCDLKPSNALVVAEQVKLMDFGVALHSQPGGAQPTHYAPAYAAPEVSRMLAVDQRADLYSLGALWYELLVGEPPQFQIGHQRLVRLTLDEALDLRQDAVPRTVSAIVAQLLALSPQDRYSSANAVISAVNKATGSTYALETRETAASYALQGRFVGREEEMAALQAAWQRAGATEGTLALVGGQSGTGKTRLLQEFAVQAELEGTRVARGQCVESGSSAYQPWREVLRVLVRYVEGTESAPMQQLGPVLATLLPELWQRPYLADVAPPPALDPQAEQLRLNHTIAQVLRAAAAARPTVVVIEDAHWADEATLELLNFLARIPAPGDLLLCVTYRDDEIAPEHTLSRLDGKRVARVTVRSLPAEVTTELVRSMLGLEQLPELLAQRVQQTTQGNAFFVQELVRSLAEDGIVLQRTVSGWQVNGQALLAAALPDSIRHVILRRLDRLPALERAVLRRAAVVGPVFWDGVLAQMDETTIDRVRATLRALGDKGLILEQDESAFVGVQEYTFEHAILREVTYESMLQEERPAYHARVAGWLVEHSGERESEYTSLIAGHFAQAGQLEQALDYSLPAARQAQAAYANEEAISWYNRTLDMLNQLGPEKASPFQSLRLSAHQSLGEVLTLVSRYDEALEHYASARAMLEAERLVADQSRQLADLCYQTARAYEKHSEYDLASEWLEKGLRHLDENEPTTEIARLYNMSGWVHVRQGDYKAAQTQLERALNLAQAARTLNASAEFSVKAPVEPLRMVEADSLRILSVICWYLGDYAGARIYSEQSLRICREIGYWLGEGKVFHNLGNVCLGQGDYAGARAYNEQALLIYREIGDQQGEGGMLHNLGLVSDNLGDYAGARAYYEQSLLIYREIGYRHDESLTLSNLGLLFHRMGDDKATQEYSQQALLIAQDLGTRSVQGAALMNLGNALAGLGSLTEATAAYRQSLALRRELGELHLAMETLAGLARVSLAQSDLIQAQAQVEEILSYLETNTPSTGFAEHPEHSEQTGHGLDGTDEPFRVYLTCYRVLCANQDPRTQDILNTAHRLLQEQAAKISDEEMRRLFLENVAVHREIVSEFARSN